jgi:rhodanese-related sulfurtransferase
MIEKSKPQTNPSGRTFFDYMPKEKLAEIARVAQNKVMPAGTVIFRQGDPGESFYVIRSGKVRAYRENEEGVITDLAVLGPGDGFGELNLLTGGPRVASVECVEETMLSVISKEQFDQILKEYPLVALSFVRDVANVLLQVGTKLEQETQLQFKAAKISWRDFVLIFGVILLCGFFVNFSNPQGIPLLPHIRSGEPLATVPPSLVFIKYAKQQALFVDARPTDFYNQQHIKGALNIPLDLFDIVYLMELSEVDKSKEIIVYGRTLSSLYDEQVAGKLMLRGHKNVALLAGGLSAWVKSRYPVEP